jgi:hypothetical protein
VANFLLFEVFPGKLRGDSRTYSLNNYEALKALVCENHPNWKYSNKLPTDKYTKADKINPTTVSR